MFEAPDTTVVALLAKRTFWEKATILHAEYHRAPAAAMPARYSRHYYDLAVLARGEVKHQASADLDLLAQVVRHKKMFYPSAWARYDLAVPGTLRLTPHEARVLGLRQDYCAMRADDLWRGAELRLHSCDAGA
ncbi:MAG: nucleotidyl transferase AbiEii/AbiGii toxin family protein [Terriglobales bacterium]